MTLGQEGRDPMGKYILKRLLASILTIILVVSVVFLLLRMMDSDNFFNEDEQRRWDDRQKGARLESVGVMKTCPDCAGSGYAEDGTACPTCRANKADSRGIGYVERGKLEQLVDFFGKLVEYRAYTPAIVGKAKVEVITASVFIAKDYSEKKDAGLTEIKATTESGSKKKVYINLAEGDSKKDAYLENGSLFVKKTYDIIGEDETVPEGMTTLQAQADDGTTRTLAVFVSEDEHLEQRRVSLKTEIASNRDFEILEDGHEAKEGYSVYEVKVGDKTRRIAVHISDEEVFLGVDVSTKQEDLTVPFFPYIFARLRGEDPFADYKSDTTYVRACFNLGRSYRLEKNQYVVDLISSKLSISMEIGLIALAISLVLGVVIGVIQSKNRVVDAIGTGYTVMVNAVPHLVIYTIIMMAGASIFNLPMRYDATAETPWLTKVLPVICLSVGSTAGYMLWTRRYMVDELNKDYIRLARLKGLSETQVMFRHVLKNAFVPLAQYLPYSILLTVGGSLLVERFFSVPGMGSKLTDAIAAYDVNTVQGIVMLYATMGILGVFLGDLLMTLIDPRIKLTGKEGVR